MRTAWLALGAVALALVAAAAVIADRLARSVTRDATELAGTARALAAGEGDARAEPGPTPELAEAARALNLLAERIDELRAAERERVADLSHRLRTPLTALRLDAEAAGETRVVDGVERLEAAVSELVRSARLPLHDSAVSATCDVAAVARERAEFWTRWPRTTAGPGGCRSRSTIRRRARAASSGSRPARPPRRSTPWSATCSPTRRTPAPTPSRSGPGGTGR